MNRKKLMQTLFLTLLVSGVTTTWATMPDQDQTPGSGCGYSDVSMPNPPTPIPGCPENGGGVGGGGCGPDDTTPPSGHSGFFDDGGSAGSGGGGCGDGNNGGSGCGGFF